MHVVFKIILNLFFIYFCLLPITITIQILFLPIFLFRYILSKICIYFNKRTILNSLSSLFIFIESDNEKKKKKKKITKSAINSTAITTTTTANSNNGLLLLWNGPIVLITIVLNKSILNTQEFIKRLNENVIYLRRGQQKSASAEEEDENSSNNNAELVYPELQEEIKIWFGYPFFQQEKLFCTENHIFEYEIKGILGENEVEIESRRIAQEFINRPLITGKSPWEILLIKRPLKGTVLCLRFHHGLGDGFSIMDAFLKVADDDKKDLTVIKQQQQQKEHSAACPASSSSSRWNSIYFALMVPIFGTYHAGRISIELIKASLKCKYYFTNRKVEHATKLSSVLNKNQQDESVNKLLLVNPIPNPNKLDGQLLLYFGQTTKISFLKIKNIAQSYKVPTTSVLLTGIAFGLRNYLMEIFDDKQIPEYLLLGLPFPVAKNHPKKLSNYYRSLVVRLPLKTKTLEDTFQYCCRNVQYEKKWLPYVSIVENFFKKIFTHLPATWKVIPTCGDPLSPITVNIFPGPLDSIDILSNSVTSLYYQLNLECLTGVGISILTYNGKLQITICASKVPTIISSQREMDLLISKIEEQVKHVLELHIV